MGIISKLISRCFGHHKERFNEEDVYNFLCKLNAKPNLVIGLVDYIQDPKNSPHIFDDVFKAACSCIEISRKYATSKEQANGLNSDYYCRSVAEICKLPFVLLIGRIENLSLVEIIIEAIIKAERHCKTTATVTGEFTLKQMLCYWISRGSIAEDNLKKTVSMCRIFFKDKFKNNAGYQDFEDFMSNIENGDIVPIKDKSKSMVKVELVGAVTQAFAQAIEETRKEGKDVTFILNVYRQHLDQNKTSVSVDGVTTTTTASPDKIYQNLVETNGCIACALQRTDDLINLRGPKALF